MTTNGIKQVVNYLQITYPKYYKWHNKESLLSFVVVTYSEYSDTEVIESYKLFSDPDNPPSVFQIVTTIKRFREHR